MMNFYHMKQDVLYTMLPQYVKSMQSVDNIAQCEQPTIGIIQKLVEFMLPDKIVSFSERKDQKAPEESKESLGEGQNVPDICFVAEIHQEAERFEEAAQVKKAQIESLDSFVVEELVVVVEK